MRNCDCSSPNGGTPLNAPKKSASIVARGAHLPSTGAALKVKLMRVFRTSPSKIPRLAPGCPVHPGIGTGQAAISAFWPCPKELNSPRSLNIVALTKPRSEEHTSELQSHVNLVCRLLLEKKKK